MKNISSKIFIVLIMLFFWLNVFGQKEANIWYFGVNAGLDFNSGAPVALTNSAMNVWEGTASIANANGQLLFYTNGVTVWNKNHATMTNGTGLNGDPSSTSSAVIVPKPGSIDSFFVFTVDNEAGPSGIDYSIVDMSQSGGLGSVVAKNVNLSPGTTTEKITAVRHCNGKDIWVIGHNWSSDQFYIWLVTQANAVPQLVATQSIGMVHNGSANNTIGFMKASPNGKKLALATNSNNRVEIYDFDNLNGVLSNLVTVNNLNYCYGIEFSPDSRRLYVSAWYNINNSGRKIYQFDLTAANIPASQYTINTQQELGAIQLGPDGKIYASRGSTNSFLLGRMNGNNQFLGVITNPNALGAVVNYVEQGVNLGSRVCDHGLPTFIQTYFNDTTKSLTYNDTCLGNATQFVAALPNDADSMRLFFGDGQSTNQINSTHTYAAAGSYNLKLMIYKRCNNDSILKNIQIIQAAPVTIAGNNSVCSNAQAENYSVVFQNGTTYLWTVTGGTITAGQGTNSITVNWANANGTVSVSAQSGACTTTNTLNVAVGNSNPVSVSITANQNNVCSGTNIIFTATPVNGGTSPQYQWLVNNNPVGSNSNTYSSSSLNNGDVVSVVLNSSASCVVNNPAVSNNLNIVISGSLPLSVNITANGLPACPGDVVSFSATTANAGNNITYQWRVNGNNVGTNNSTYSSTALNNGDVVTCVVTSNATCLTNNPATSNAITITTQNSQALAVNITSPSNTICAGGTTTFTATVTNGGATPQYEWQINGNNTGINSATFQPATLNNGDVVSCVVTGSSSCVTGSPATSNQIVITVVSATVPQITLQASVVEICEGNNILFTATASNAGNAPQYEWFVNGIAQGNNTTSFNTTTLSNNDVISVSVLSSDVCANPQSAASNTITVSVIPVTSPQISILADLNPSCIGQTINFSSTVTDAGTTPNITWYVNNTAVLSGSNIFSSNQFNDNDEVYAEVVSSALCATPTLAVSNIITVRQLPNLSPEVLINADSILCRGDNVLITATTNNAVAPQYTWQLNGNNLSVTDSLLLFNTLNNGDTILCSIVSNNTCSNNNNAISNSIVFSINEKPVAAINTTGTLNVCKEEYVLLASIENFDNYNWQLPTGTAVSKEVTANAEGNYTLIVEQNGCLSEPVTVWVEDMNDCKCEVFFPNAFSPNSDNENDLFKAVTTCVPEYFTLRIYNRWGEKIFETSDYTSGWDGTYKNKLLDVGVYVYTVTYINREQLAKKYAKGSVTLVR